MSCVEEPNATSDRRDNSSDGKPVSFKCCCDSGGKQGVIDWGNL